MNPVLKFHRIVNKTENQKKKKRLVRVIIYDDVISNNAHSQVDFCRLKIT